MEPAQANPVKKRRRWLIAALVAVLCGLYAWWNHPVIDQSLIGKWTISAPGIKEGYFGPLWLKSNGTGQVMFPESKVLSRVFEWRVKGGTLTIDVPRRSGFLWWDRAMQRAYFYTGSKFFRGSERWRISRSDSGNLDLVGSEGFLPSNCRLERIPE